MSDWLRRDQRGYELEKGALFPLGQLLVTSLAFFELSAVQGEGPIVAYEGLLERHMAGDWGPILCAEHRAANDRAVVDGGRIVSAYELDGIEVLLVVTDAERSRPAAGRRRRRRVVIHPMRDGRSRALRARRRAHRLLRPIPDHRLSSTPARPRPIARPPVSGQVMSFRCGGSHGT